MKHEIRGRDKLIALQIFPGLGANLWSNVDFVKVFGSELDCLILLIPYTSVSVDKKGRGVSTSSDFTVVRRRQGLTARLIAMKSG